MPTPRSDSSHSYWRESAEKFDYFVTGVTGALTAYVGENIHPIRLGLNAPTVEVIALALLTGSVIYGFKRIEAMVHFQRLQTQQLYAQEARGSNLVATQSPAVINVSTGEVYTPKQLAERAEAFRVAGEKLEPIIEAAAVMGLRYYRWRNRLLVIGFITLVIARLLPAYLS
jgi:hypothetical protein